MPCTSSRRSAVGAHLVQKLPVQLRSVTKKSIRKNLKLIFCNVIKRLGIRFVFPILFSHARRFNRSFFRMRL